MHVGKGATVGSVIPTKHAIIPAAVGVDIGCGMNAIRLSLKASQLPDNLSRLGTPLNGKCRLDLLCTNKSKRKLLALFHLKNA